jgi:hypothetical protein
MSSEGMQLAMQLRSVFHIIESYCPFQRGTQLGRGGGEVYCEERNENVAWNYVAKQIINKLKITDHRANHKLKSSPTKYKITK